MEVYKDKISNVEEVKAQLLSNRAGTIAILKNIKEPAAPKAPPAAPLHNARTAGTPGPVIDVVQNRQAAEVAKKVSNRAREIVKNLGISHQQAFIMAQGELPREERLNQTVTA